MTVNFFVLQIWLRLEEILSWRTVVQSCCVSFGPLGHLNFGVFELKQILIHPAPSSVTFRLALRDEVCWFESKLDDVGWLGLWTPPRTGISMEACQSIHGFHKTRPFRPRPFQPKWQKWNVSAKWQLAPSSPYPQFIGKRGPDSPFPAVQTISCGNIFGFVFWIRFSLKISSISIDATTMHDRHFLLGGRPILRTVG